MNQMNQTKSESDINQLDLNKNEDNYDDRFVNGMREMNSHLKYSNSMLFDENSKKNKISLEIANGKYYFFLLLFFIIIMLFLVYVYNLLVTILENQGELLNSVNKIKNKIEF